LKNHFVLVDFENIQPKDIGLLNGGPFKIKVFLGASQGKIPVETARVLQKFGPDAEYITIDGNGRNALDFHIAYYMGRLAAEYPDSHFYVVSKDKGFDPLIKHLNSRKVHCQRSVSIADIPRAKVPVSGGEVNKVDAVIENLERRKAAKPRTLKTLQSTIKALFVNKLTDDEADAIVKKLVERRVITIAAGKVSYGPAS